jgi:hypothetical protein
LDQCDVRLENAKEVIENHGVMGPVEAAPESGNLAAARGTLPPAMGPSIDLPQFARLPIYAFIGLTGRSIRETEADAGPRRGRDASDLAW